MSILTAILIGLLLTVSPKPDESLKTIRETGELRVLTRNNPTTYYEGADGPTGFDYDLVKGFADSLKVRLRLMPASGTDAVLTALQRGDAHLAAAGIKVTPEHMEKARFGAIYQSIQEQLVYRDHPGHHPPQTLQDVVDKRFEVAAHSSYAATLRGLSTDYPALTWRENSRGRSGELMALVWERALDYTIADSNEIALSRSAYPELRVAFNIGEPKHLAWAFPLQADESLCLYRAALRYFDRIQKNGQLDQLIERHYGHVERFDYVGTRRFLAHMNERLPRYLKHFQHAAEHHGLDWRLLCAIGYQESHWNEQAISPTGVRGIMMLTQDTAAQVGIKNRLDAKQSIDGGARYFASLKTRIPKEVSEPDRTWFALAAYNIGLGHLEDARRFADEGGSNANRWVDVKKFLPLLSKQEWSAKTRYGYARGEEPVSYVQSVRRYFDWLVRADKQNSLLATR